MLPLMNTSQKHLYWFLYPFTEEQSTAIYSYPIKNQK